MKSTVTARTPGRCSWPVKHAELQDPGARRGRRDPFGTGDLPDIRGVLAFGARRRGFRRQDEQPSQVCGFNDAQKGGVEQLHTHQRQHRGVDLQAEGATGRRHPHLRQRRGRRASSVGDSDRSGSRDRHRSRLHLGGLRRSARGSGRVGAVRSLDRVRAGTVVPALRWVSLTVRRSPVGIPGSTAVAPGPCLPPG
jgi:hypothetical protein